MKRLCLGVLLVGCVLVLGGCGGDDEKGACVRQFNPLLCGDDFNNNECDMMNGTFYSGKKCSEL